MGSNIEKLISFRILRKYLNSFWNETFDEKGRIQRRRKIDDSADVRWHSLLSCRSRTFSSFFPHLIYLRRFMSSVSLSCSLNCDFVCFDINCKQVHISFLHQLSKQRNCWPGKVILKLWDKTTVRYLNVCLLSCLFDIIKSTYTCN